METRMPAAAYRQELRNLHVLRDYRACKNSFVLGLETRSERPQILKPGDRKTVLRAEGSGSLRHIWETHGPGPGPFILEFYVDGEAEPSLRGGLEELIDAARRARQPLVLNAGGHIAKGSHNLYLPVPFERSLRVDLVVTKPLGLIFMQLDYRVEDDSLKGVRLTQRGEGAAMELAYTGLAPDANYPPPAASPRRERFELTGNGRVRIEGPAIIRRLAINARRPGARLRVRFDGEPTAAIDADLADFFGPFRGTAFNNNQCFLPMPFAKAAEIEIAGAGADEEWRLEADVEPVAAFKPDWGWLHARSSDPQVATGFEPVQVLDTRGRGHWLGMALYQTGHDHGGGDFALVDADSPAPGFLHGINGEDYFSFAFFGRGENFPYSEAFDNDTGRLRLHLENPYAFRQSLSVGWGTLRGEKPRGVSFWYQDSPKDLTQTPEQARGLAWQVFGPLEAPVLADGNTPDTASAERLFAPLPAEADLDAGKPVEAIHAMFQKRHTGQFKGWADQAAVGPHLNLMYVYGHAMKDLADHHHMAYYARLMMARARLTSDRERRVTLQLSYDDPLRVELNGETLLTDLELREGYATRTVEATLRAGENRLLVRLADTPNNNTCWAGLSLRILDEQGREISAQLQPPAPAEPKK